MNDVPTGNDAMRRYEQALGAGVRLAERYVAGDQAMEIAHDVASELLRRLIARPTDFPNERAIAAFVRRSVMNRLRDAWRNANRRKAAEQLYHEEWSGVQPEWSMPGGSIETRELQRVLDATIAAMPPAMRQVFLLVREEGLSYKEVATRLGVGPGTVHTQLSRANALLHRAVSRYRSGEESAPRAGDRPATMRILP